MRKLTKDDREVLALVRSLRETLDEIEERVVRHGSRIFDTPSGSIRSAMLGEAALLFAKLFGSR